MRKLLSIYLCLVGCIPIADAACVVTKHDNKNSWVTNFESSNPGATSVSLTTNTGGTALQVTAGDLIVIHAWCKPSCSVVSMTMGTQTIANGQVQQTSVTANVSAVGQSRIFYITAAAATGAQDITFVRSGTANDGTQHQIAAFSFSASSCTWTHGIDTAVASNLGTLNANAPSITAPGTLLITDTMMVGHTNTPGYGSPWAQTIWAPDSFSGLTNTSNGLSYMLPPSNVGTVANNVTEQSGTGPGWAGMLVSFIPTTNQLHYISSAGSDANNGTAKGTPWAHLPGMPNCASVCAAYTPVAGDQFIFKGGESWLAASLGINWQWNGTSAAPIYIGVDQTWFTGASWTRPKLDCQVTSCASNQFGNILWMAGNFTIIDNLEMTGYKQSAAGNIVGVFGNDNEVENFYIHNFSRTVGSSGVNTFCFSNNFSSGGALRTKVHNNVCDGEDSPDKDFMGGSLHGDQVYNNIFRYIYNGLNGNFNDIHGNLIEHVYVSPSGDHCNNIFAQHIFTGNTLWAYNNIIRHMDCSGGAPLWAVTTSVQTAWIYNNVIYDVGNGGVPKCVQTGDHPAAGAGGIYNLYNNTCEAAGSEAFGNGETSPRATLNYRNNHIINSTLVCDGNGVTCVNQGNNLSQTLVQANGQGYNDTQTYAYSPTSSGASTVNTGGNLTASCSGNVAALCSDTTYPTYDTTNHVVVMRAVVSRPAVGVWDEGAFEFAGGGGGSSTINLSPSSLTFANQNVGTSSASQGISLTNTGTITMNISSLAVTGTNPGDFSQTNTCSTTLAASASCTITVTFTPASVGSRSAGITVTSDASNSPVVAGLTGTGIIAFSSMNGVIIDGAVTVH